MSDLITTLKKTLLLTPLLMLASLVQPQHLGGSTAFAGEYDIKQETPAIQQAFSGRQGRYSTVLNLKNQGIVGETNQGYLATLSNQGNAADIVNAENNDRRVIYNAIVEQNNLGSGGLAKVQIAFGDVQRDRAQSGEMVQTPSGDWVKK